MNSFAQPGSTPAYMYVNAGKKDQLLPINSLLVRFPRKELDNIMCLSCWLHSSVSVFWCMTRVNGCSKQFTWAKSVITVGTSIWFHPNLDLLYYMSSLVFLSVTMMSLVCSQPTYFGGGSQLELKHIKPAKESAIWIPISSFKPMSYHHQPNKIEVKDKLKIMIIILEVL